MRTRRLATVLVLAAALALAGCGGSGGTTTTAANATDATDAAGTATTTNSNQNVEYPAGVTADGLQNRTALFAADWTALNESGFVADAWINQSVSGRQSTNIAAYQRARVESGGGNAALQIRRRSPSRDVDTNVWQNTTFGLTRIVETAPDGASATQFRRRDEVDRFRTNPITSGGPASLVAIGEYDSVSVEGSGADTRITLTADGVNETRASGLRFNVSGYAGELVVDRTGRIRTIDVTLETSGQQAAAYAVDYDLRRTGGTTVSRPAWFDRGLAQAPNVSVSAELVDGRYIALTNEGPDTLDADWQVQLQTRLAPLTGNLSTSVAPGETVYLSIANGSRQVQVTTTVPTDTRPLSGVRAVTVVEPSLTGQPYPIAGDGLTG